MKTIMITAPSSNTGKTTLTLGIIRALKNRKLDVSAFKTGPDFIDTKYLKMASKKDAGNLDMHMMGRDNVLKSLSINRGTYAVIEGAMGYFDGIFNTFENSSYDISRRLDIPVVLVYRPKGEMFSAIPKIKGMVDFSQGRIKGVILNKCSKSSYMLLKPQIEKYLDIKVLGHIEEDEKLRVEESILGLDESNEEKMEEIIENTSKLVEENLDLDGFIDLMEDIGLEEFKLDKKHRPTLAIAKDQAFSFHYNENIKILEKICELKYFSPLKDESLPKCDLVYLGGGYPEKFLEELSSNLKMQESIRNYVENSGYLLAEGGGLMYMTQAIEGYPMLGIFKGQASLINRLERFGYTRMEILQDSILGKKGRILYGNEYHKSKVDMDMEPIFNITKPKGKKTWQCGYAYKNALGYYGHINFLGNMEALDYLLEKIRRVD